MRRLVLFGRSGPAFEFAGPSCHESNGAGVDTQEVMASGRARLFRGCVWSDGRPRFGDALASRGWVR